MESYLAREWHDHEQLLIGGGNEFRFGVEALRPCLLADGAPAVGCVFVEGYEGVEVDLGSKNILEGWCEVVGVVMYLDGLVKE